VTTFSDLGLHPSIQKALAAENYTNPTPIQAQSIPHLMQGRDLLGIAQTGTGKTAAFALPILHRLAETRKPAPRKSCRALILSPTRELASQIADSFRTYGKHMGLSVAVVFGGVSAGPQIRTLANGVDILVATPGRLLDHLRGNALRLDPVEIFVLDEADQMLDMGFIRDIRKIVSALPKQRQNLFFSATMPKEIGVLAGELLKDPIEVAVTPVAKTADRVTQQVAFVDGGAKRELLVNLLKNRDMHRVLVFARTKHGADKIARHLEQAGVAAAAIHGNKSQNQRERALKSFKAGQTRALVATDIAARGIDIDGVTHVVNYELPNIPESYVHRIGRTARAGNDGSAISFCAPDERAFLRDIERLIQQTVPFLEGYEGSRETPRGVKPANPHRRGNQNQNHHNAGGQKKHHRGRPNGNNPNGQQANGGGNGQNANGERHANGGNRQGQQQNRGGQHRNGNGNQQRHRQDGPQGERPNGDLNRMSFMKPTGREQART
jgi:ATP-dependent RNA helicase RhlE